MTTPLRIQASRPLRGGLDSVAVGLPELTEDDWKVGVELTPPARGSVSLWDATGCNDEGYALDDHDASDPLTEKPVEGVATGFKFYPGMIVAQSECEVGGSVSAIGNIILENAQADLDRNAWRAAEAILHGIAPVLHPGGLERNASLNNYGIGGDPTGPSDPTLPDGFDPAAPGDLKGTLQGLLDSVCACAKGDLTLHVPVSFLPYFLADGVVKWDPESGRYLFGTHEVSFGCYPNRGPNAQETASPTATDGTEVWIWATGPVYVEFGADQVLGEITRRQNLYTAIVERPVLVAFDPACVYAAKAQVA